MHRIMVVRVASNHEARVRFLLCAPFYYLFIMEKTLSKFWKFVLYLIISIIVFLFCVWAFGTWINKCPHHWSACEYPIMMIDEDKDAMVEWLGGGLQPHTGWFDSNWRLQSSIAAGLFLA